jgi:hypothetical protein
LLNLWAQKQERLIKKLGDVTKNISEGKIWQKIIKGLNKEKVDYILVGASALVLHGFPRSTLDIDIYVLSKASSLDKLFKIADTLNLQSEQESILHIRRSPRLFSNQWICFSYEGQDILDVFFADKGDFNKLYKNSELKKDKKISIRVASLKDIIAMKKASGRPIDLSDLQMIKEESDT